MELSGKIIHCSEGSNPEADVVEFKEVCFCLGN